MLYLWDPCDLFFISIFIFIMIDHTCSFAFFFRILYVLLYLVDNVNEEYIFQIAKIQHQDVA